MDGMPDRCIIKWSVVDRVLVTCASDGPISDESLDAFNETVVTN